jgi:hypothetical protein
LRTFVSTVVERILVLVQMSNFVLMEEQEHPVIGFGLAYANQLIYCEAVMQEDAFDVLFNGRWVASIAYNEDWHWMQASGIMLQKDTIAPIGLKIESYYA